MATSDLAEAAETLLDDLLRRYPLPARPRLVWKNLRVSAGIAYARSNEIGLSRLLLTTADRLRDTLVHEYAHLLAAHRHGPQAAGHGPGWRAAMLELGAEPKVRHGYEVVRNEKRRQAVYCCVKCGATLVRSRRLPRGRRYSHTHCGGAIRLASYSFIPDPAQPSS